MGKMTKKAKGEETNVTENYEPDPPEDRVKFLSPIAKPLAGRKLTKKIYRLIRKASKDKKYFFDGLKNVQLRLRKMEKGLVIFAGDVYPIDIMSHLPGLCEDLAVPYCYIPSRRDLGMAMGVNRSLVTVMIKEKEDYSELYRDVVRRIKLLPIPF